MNQKMIQRLITTGGTMGKIWERIVYEDHLPPTVDALRLHWLRTTWVIDYWRQSTKNTIDLLPVEEYGWKVDGSIARILYFYSKWPIVVLGIYLAMCCMFITSYGCCKLIKKIVASPGKER